MRRGGGLVGHGNGHWSFGIGDGESMWEKGYFDDDYGGKENVAIFKQTEGEDTLTMEAQNTVYWFYIAIETYNHNLVIKTFF